MTLELVAISTSKYITTVNAKIDNHVYTVRKMGAGTQLDLSREITTLAKSRTTILNLESKMKLAKTEEEQQQLLDELTPKMEEFDKIIKRIEDIFVSIFDDREDGSKSRRLVHTLGLDNIQLVYNEIFEKAEDEPKDA